MAHRHQQTQHTRSLTAYIETQHGIDNLVKRFYAKVQTDVLLGPVFNETAKVNWEKHIPLLCQFWRSIMLKTGEYHGHAYKKHELLGQLTDLNRTHLERWLELFEHEAYHCLPDTTAKLIIKRAHFIGEALSNAMNITQ